MSEHSIAQARASVMLYNNEAKQWAPSGGSQGISRVHVYHHPVNNTFRIVGRKMADHAVVINCALAKGLKYNEATPTFHQWRDQRQVYGLNFQSKDEADLFGQAVRDALETLKTSAPPSAAPVRASPSPQQQFSGQQAFVYQQDGMANGRGNEQEDMLSQIRMRQGYDQQDHEYQRSTSQDRSYRYDDQESSSSSQVSASSSGPSIASQPPQPPAPPAAPFMAPAAPPAPPPPGAPAAPPAPPFGGPPSAPPPPPAPPVGGGGSLADQLAAAKLRKSSRNEAADGGIREQRSGSRSAGGSGGIGGLDMMAEMSKKLAARRAKAEDPDPNGSVKDDMDRSAPVSRSNPSPVFPSNKQQNFPTPAKTSTVSKPEGRFNGGKSDINNDQLEALKSEILAEFRMELDSFKQDIIAAIRQEVSRYR
ncbi:protein enabled isoform X2 [Nematostella vectensis]|uniref:protein enabled isoform X2 n=1 Tax=Nematostella vectensis TaxID=45351 RepID=UPI00139057A6|nr:protein enabled isoform X2 [Nematostella vectensis]